MCAERCQILVDPILTSCRSIPEIEGYMYVWPTWTSFTPERGQEIYLQKRTTHVKLTKDKKKVKNQNFSKTGKKQQTYEH